MSNLPLYWTVDPHEHSTSMSSGWPPMSTLHLCLGRRPYETIYHYAADPTLRHKIINELDGDRIAAITDTINRRIVRDPHSDVGVVERAT